MHRRALLIPLALAAAPALATDYYVRATGSNGQAGTSAATAWATVAYAAQRAAPGDTVYVGAGEYVGQVYMSDKGTSVSSPLRFVADTTGQWTGDEGDVTIRVSSGSALHVQRSDSVQFVGFTITNTGSTSTLIFTDTARNLLLDACTIRAGGTAVQGQNQYSFVITGCTISSQSSHALFLPGGSLTITGSTVTAVGPQNAAIYPYNGATVTADRCSFLDGYDIVYTTGADLTLTNCVFAHAARNAFYVTNQTVLRLVNCTVADVATDAVYAIGGTQTISNTVFSGVGDDVLVRVNNSNMTVTDCLFHDYADRLGDGYTVTDPLEGDPLFTNPSANDYSLREGSPAIDTGADASAYTSVDRNGRSRPLGNAWDIGAYEGVGAGVVAQRKRVIRWREVSSYDD